GCAPDLAVCPVDAPEADLKPICIRIWVNGTRFIAGLFNRVPTVDNPQSGRLRFQFPSFVDSGLSLMSITYDHSDPLDLQTDLLFFQRDPDVDPSAFFADSQQFVRLEGPEATAKKTVQLTSEFLSPPTAAPGNLQFQASYLADRDFISLEQLTDGVDET